MGGYVRLSLIGDNVSLYKKQRLIPFIVAIYFAPFTTQRMTMLRRLMLPQLKSYIFIILKMWTLIFCVCLVCYFFFNVISVNRLEREIVDDYKNVYSISRRFSSYYNNATSITLDEGRYSRNGVTVVVTRDTEVKVLSEGISKLRTELEKLIGDNLWTISVFQNPSSYFHLDPIRDSYEQFYEKIEEDNVIARIVDNENLKQTYQSFYGCNLKLTEKYIEDGTGENIRSIYYPIYNKRHLDALLVVDIKASLLHERIEHYNKIKNMVVNSQNKNNLYQKSAYLPCSELDPFTLGINLVDLIKKIIFPSLFITLALFAIGYNVKRSKFLLQYDTMTGFYRRDFYEKRLKKMKAFSLLIIDIDNFKQINDTYGHKKGDEVIQQIAQRILASVRSNQDYCIRWGGEEFIILLDSVSVTNSEEKAERIRSEIEKELIADLQVTVSIGGVVDDDTTFSDAYKRADAALYQSKNNGRNRVTMAN
ncbi:ggdef domain protein [Aliivibrio fischeri MJ11]|uniref:diguanylate cyclase n=1 Tax=Aliivibrio fischeri (strain MJ11) TaxID=388396 RepID=B5EUG0_ALIFM|nr:GGDEF domain-containing protein [Aliivibrio fischeri]ACH63992.1 ggdef domain protein [Aliivibrio fischeri MJ11]